MNIGRKLLLAALFLVSLCMKPAAWGADYYVDAVKGKDGNNGGQSAPWQTVGRVNGHPLRGGDAVYFRRGQAWKAVLVPAPGTRGKPVTYGSYGTGARPVISGCTVSDKSWVKLNDLHFSSTSGNYPLLLEKASHITVENCDIHAEPSCTAYAALRIWSDSHHNRILGCRIAHRNGETQNDALNLKHNASHNLIEGNTISTATHYALTLEGSTAACPACVCSYNIIRNNTIDNPAGAMVELQSNANRNLVEKNRITGGRTSSHNNNQPHVFKSVSMHNIIRNNILHGNSEPKGHGLSSCAYRYRTDPENNIVGNRVYNNLVTAIAGPPLILDNYNRAGSVVTDNVYKNNIAHENGTRECYQLLVGATTGVGDNYFHNNLFHKVDAAVVLKIRNAPTSVAGVEARYPGYYSGNLQKDPLLDDNFRPRAGSPCIDGGGFLTRTSGSGKGSVIKVDDAAYFCDGFGIGEGDTIRVGSVTARVTSVDYAANTITVADAFAWAEGTPVSLPFNGKRPDIGPFE